MKLSFPRLIIQRIRRIFAKDPDRFLRQVSGLIHVGANTGQERAIYDKLGLEVLWIEPIPKVFDELKSNIAKYKRQRAIQALVTDVDNKTFELHVANNNGASSSILELKDCKDIWPDLEYTGTISLTSTTLPSLLEKHKIDLSKYDALIMDTQGSEMLVLLGAEQMLKQFNFIKTEVADFEAYAGCCQLTDINDFLEKHGFREYSRHAFVQRTKGGTYYDVTYKRDARLLRL